SLLLYSYAGEKMPWLSIHIDLPLLLFAGKTVGALAPRIPWSQLRRSPALLIGPLTLLIVLALRTFLAGGDPASGVDRDARLLSTLSAGAAAAGMLVAIWYLLRRAS